MPVSDQGSLEGRYALIPRTLIFLTLDRKVLLLKGAPDKRLWANRYNGIGGHIEPGEDVLAAARRELKEESGIECDDLWLCGVVTVDTGGQLGVGIFIFCGRMGPERMEIAPISPEGALEWVDQREVMRLPLVEDLPLLLPRALRSQPEDRPFFAHSRYNEKGKMEISFSR
jgi:8-oxo-dGTP diphosphatase